MVAPCPRVLPEELVWRGEVGLSLPHGEVGHLPRVPLIPHSGVELGLEPGHTDMLRQKVGTNNNNN